MPLLFFKALADETRLRLARILLHYELSVNELVQLLGMGQSRISRHLKILSEAGLLHSHRDGLWVFYSVPESGQARAFLDAALPFANPDSSSSAEADLEAASQILEERARKARRFFNAIAADWDSLNRELLGDFDLACAVLDEIPADLGVAVDLGCGTGALLERLLGHSKALIGVDGSAQMLALARKRLSAHRPAEGQVSLRIGELSHLPLADQEADFACLNLVLHHLPSPQAGLCEIRRILKPGGRLFLADFLSHRDEAMRLKYGDHWLGFAEEDLLAALKRAGFLPGACARRAVGRGLTLLLLTASAA